jgi:hypothetical protein
MRCKKEGRILGGEGGEERERKKKGKKDFAKN